MQNRTTYQIFMKQALQHFFKHHTDFIFIDEKNRRQKQACAKLNKTLSAPMSSTEITSKNWTKIFDDKTLNKFKSKKYPYYSIALARLLKFTIYAIQQFQLNNTTANDSNTVIVFLQELLDNNKIFKHIRRLVKKTRRYYSDTEEQQWNFLLKYIQIYNQAERKLLGLQTTPSPAPKKNGPKATAIPASPYKSSDNASATSSTTHNPQQLHKVEPPADNVISKKNPSSSDEQITDSDDDNYAPIRGGLFDNDGTARNLGENTPLLPGEQKEKKPCCPCCSIL